MPTYRLDLAYDGSGFHGYARQPEVRTVQGELEQGLSRLAGPVVTEVAGRTDAGVHARGQVVSFRSDVSLEPSRVASALNGMLAPEVVVWSCRQVEDDFSARFSAVARTYRYVVLNRPLPDPFLRHTSWHYPTPLDVARMNAAAAHLVGEHDFASFCRGGDERTSVRAVHDARWERTDDRLLQFQITAGSFCHQMVRSLVAVLVEVGRGRLEADDVPGILAARDREAARGAAPPHGLTLWSVAYEEEAR